ncbi:unnamed protein product [Prorocentrum cordatum]|uniref:Apple domain-containing protein n=1 Tax=Prorocentrum cordatum TaxID=2364126 RepID=A0ABN9RVY0_9DINO|nr:unnamed protein product [Polarella glacialis]
MPRRDAVASCQGWCGSTAGCAGFTMQLATHACSLHASTGRPVRSIMGAVSGPPSCPGRAEEAGPRHGDATAALPVGAASADDVVIRAEAVSPDAALALRAAGGPPAERFAAVLPRAVPVVCALVVAAAAYRSTLCSMRGLRARRSAREAESVEDLVVTAHLINDGIARE